ncbi:MAG: hypothetical protein PVG99_05505 [Desulfobacteraceae bacterium]|jgi:hypothetical protein
MDKTKNVIEKLSAGLEYPQRRFGVIAIEKGFITADQLWEALVRQKTQDSGEIERRNVGMILKDMGYLSVSQVNEVLQAMEKEGASKIDVAEPSRKAKRGRPAKRNQDRD